MDTLRGRVRAGSRFSGEAYIPARTGRWHASPGGARAGGAATPPLPRQGTPRPPKQPGLCRRRGPAQQFHLPGGRRETRKKGRTLRPRGPGRRPPLLRVASGTLWLPCALPGGGQASDFHGSRPSQQHFGLRRDTARWGLRGVRGKRRKRERGKQRENRLKRTEKEIKGGIKPPESLFVFLRPFFLLSHSFLPVFFFFLKLFQLIGGQGAWGSSPLSLTALSQPCPPASIRPG